MAGLTLGSTAHGPGCRIWVVWPENTKTWPKSRIFGPPDRPPPARPEYGHWRAARQQPESPAQNGLLWKRMTLKGPSTWQKLLCEPETQACAWLASLWVTLRTARGAGLGWSGQKILRRGQSRGFLGRQIDPLRRGRRMGIGGHSGNSLNLRLTTDFFEKGWLSKDLQLDKNCFVSRGSRLVRG